MSVYLNDWANGGERVMLSDFGIDSSALQGARILVASYAYENYEGDAYVLFERDGRLFEVHGSHCSCYGLSEQSYDGGGGTQWEPEETTEEVIRHRLEKGTFYETAQVRDAVLDALNNRKDAA